MWLHVLCVWFLIATRIFAQSRCEGDTSIYNKNGLTVFFKNLCGKDITTQVDFLDPTNELTWSDCLDRCVEKAPLCYGFDFTPPGTASYSCWLMNATFLEDSALSKPYTVDAAMLDSNLVAGLSDDCQSLGLSGCYQKNDQLGTSATTAPRTSSITSTTRQSFPSTTSVTISTTAVTTNASGEATTIIMTVTAESASPASSEPTLPRGGLSTSAKAGIGAGVGGAILFAGLASGIFFLDVANEQRQKLLIRNPLRLRR
jgi:hypothetical protein